MRLWLLAAALSLVTAGGCFAEDQPPPDEFIYDFGQVKQGSVQEHSFIFKNETAQALTIKDINTSCGCTTSAVKKKVLPPGESAEIEVKFNSQGYSGAVQQFVYVNTDSLDNPVVKYIIKADVIK